MNKKEEEEEEEEELERKREQCIEHSHISVGSVYLVSRLEMQVGRLFDASRRNKQ